MYWQPAPYHPPPLRPTDAAVAFAMGAVLATILGLFSLAVLADHVLAKGAFDVFDFVLSLIFFGCIAIIARLAVLAQQERKQQLEQHYATYMAQQEAIRAQLEQLAREEAAQQDRKAYPDRIGALQSLLNLTPTQFELAIADLLKFWGYSNVEHTGGNGDMAADIVCNDTTGQMTIVQCKHYMPGNLVSLPEVQTFIDIVVAHQGTVAGIYFTTSGYTEPAFALGQTQRIMMIDGTSLIDHFLQFRAAMEQQA